MKPLTVHFLGTETFDETENMNNKTTVCKTGRTTVEICWQQQKMVDPTHVHTVHCNIHSGDSTHGML